MKINSENNFTSEIFLEAFAHYITFLFSQSSNPNMSAAQMAEVNVSLLNNFSQSFFRAQREALTIRHEYKTKKKIWVLIRVPQFWLCSLIRVASEWNNYSNFTGKIISIIYFLWQILFTCIFLLVIILFLTYTIYHWLCSVITQVEKSYRQWQWPLYIFKK